MRPLRAAAALALGILWVTGAQAEVDPAKHAAAERLAATYNYEDMVATILNGGRAMLAPADQAQLEERLKPLLTTARLRQLQVDTVEQVLETDEIEALAAFFESPIGQRIRTKEAKMAVLVMQRQQCLLLPIVRDMLVEALAQQVPSDKMAEATQKMSAAFDAQSRYCADL
jgi:hypothetical protein